MEIERKKFPTRPAPILTVATPPSFDRVEQTWAYYAYGYGAGFEQLADAYVASWPNREYLRLPMVFLCRHAMELSIKSVIAECRSLAGGSPDIQGHNLDSLWSSMEAHLKVAGVPVGEPWGLRCRQLVRHFQEMDSEATKLRYPSDRTGAQHDFVQVDVEELMEAYLNVSHYAEVCVSMVRGSLF